MHSKKNAFLSNIVSLHILLTMTRLTSQNNKTHTDTAPNTKQQFYLGTGILLMLIGIFISFSIISYCFTWKSDQNALINPGSMGNFLVDHDATVANWGGRLGAALSHMLVFRGAGIASFVIGVWIAALGMNLVYGAKIKHVFKYFRWISILLLVGAPTLAYLLPHHPFSFGGAWGNEAIAWLNGFIGKTGTGLLLGGTILFFVFTLFALDIAPLIQKTKAKANKLKNALISEQISEKSPTEDDEAITEKPKPQLISLEEQEPPVQQTDLAVATQSDMPLHFTTAPPKPQTLDLNTEETHNALINTPVIEEDVQVTVALEEEIEEPEDDVDFSFEVIQQQEPSVEGKNAHISIESDEPYAPELDLPHYKFPTLDLLEVRSETITLDKAELEKNKNQIIHTLRSFGIEIQRISATVGPTVTLYEIVPAEGVRISKIRNLEDDIALNLAALGIRIIAPIPGKGTIGIEVPNAQKQIVSMRAMLSSEKFANSKMSLPIALGKKIDNENYIVDLATMPHLLVAGATGQGKSVGINAILVSLLYKKHPSQLKFVLVDPKKVELSIYRLIENHFLAKLPNEEESIITDTKKVIYTLNALCIEMDNRYELLKEAGARNIKEYNEKFIKRKLNPLRGHKYLPFIVLVIDEFADLIMTAGKEVEMPIARLAQLARAVGIHLIIATQRPSVNVITGTIKANFPARMAFKVSAKVDSRTILDTGGAEQLIGRGDMLVSHGSELLRLQCAFVDTPEVEKIVEFIGSQQGYPAPFELPEYEGEDEGTEKNLDLTNRDKLFEECARVVVQTQSGSTSMLQRRFNLGYNRAGRIMDQLEAAGIVGPASGSKPREVLFRGETELEQFLNNLL